MGGGEEVWQGVFLSFISFHMYLNGRAGVREQLILTLGRVTLFLSDLGKGQVVMSTGLLTIYLSVLDERAQSNPSLKFTSTLGQARRIKGT